MDIKIISQTAEIFEGTCKKVTVPTLMGEITILPHHTNIITVLDIGLLVIELEDGSRKEILVNGGILEMVNNRINILANEADLREDLVEKEILNAIDAAQRKMSADISKADFIRLERQLRYHKFKHSLLKK